MKTKMSAILKSLLAGIVVFTMGYGIAWADGKDYLNFVRISTGVYQPTGDLDDADYDAGSAFSVLYGRYLGRHLVLEGGGGFLYTERDLIGNTPVAGFYIEEDSVSIISLNATVKAVYPIGRLELVGGAGIDGHFVSLNAEVTSSNFGDDDADDEDAVFGFHVVGGVQYKITERFLLGGEFTYLWTDDVEITKPIADIPIGLQGNLNGFIVSFTFGYRF